MSGIKPFGLPPEELARLYIKEADERYQRRLKDNPTDDALEKCSIKTATEQEALLQVINKNNVKLTTDILTAIEDYLFNKLDITTDSSRLAEAIRRLDQLEKLSKSEE